MNTFPVLHAFIVNVKPSAISACMSFNFLKQSQSSSANGKNVLFL